MSFLKPKALTTSKHTLRENILKMQEHPVFFSVRVHEPSSYISEDDDLIHEYPPRIEFVLEIRWLKRDDNSVRLAIYNPEGGYIDWILHEKQMVLDYATPNVPRPASFQKRWCKQIAQGCIRYLTAFLNSSPYQWHFVEIPNSPNEDILYGSRYSFCVRTFPHPCYRTVEFSASFDSTPLEIPTPSALPQEPQSRQIAQALRLAFPSLKQDTLYRVQTLQREQNHSLVLFRECLEPNSKYQDGWVTTVEVLVTDEKAEVIYASNRAKEALVQEEGQLLETAYLTMLERISTWKWNDDLSPLYFELMFQQSTESVSGSLCPLVSWSESLNLKHGIKRIGDGSDTDTSVTALTPPQERVLECLLALPVYPLFCEVEWLVYKVERLDGTFRLFLGEVIPHYRVVVHLELLLSSESCTIDYCYQEEGSTQIGSVTDAGVRVDWRQRVDPGSYRGRLREAVRALFASDHLCAFSVLFRLGMGVSEPSRLSLIESSHVEPKGDRYSLEDLEAYRQSEGFSEWLSQPPEGCAPAVWLLLQQIGRYPFLSHTMKLRYMKRRNGDALIMLIGTPVSMNLGSPGYNAIKEWISSNYVMIEWLWSNDKLSVLYADPSLDGMEVMSELGEPSLATIALLGSYEREGKAYSDDCKSREYEAEGIRRDLVFQLCCSSTEVIVYIGSIVPFYPLSPY